MTAFFSPEMVEHAQLKMSEVSFQQMDANKDGKVEKDEVFPPEQAEEMGGQLDGVDFSEVFRMHDKDGDGYFDVNELAGFEGSWTKVEKAFEAMFAIADKNKDGFVTQHEFISEMPKWEATKNEAVFELQSWQDFYD